MKDTSIQTKAGEIMIIAMLTMDAENNYFIKQEEVIPVAKQMVNTIIRYHDKNDYYPVTYWQDIYNYIDTIDIKKF